MSTERPRGNTPVRTFRIDDAHWQRLNVHAHTQGITASDVLRDLIETLPDARTQRAD